MSKLPIDGDLERRHGMTPLRIAKIETFAVPPRWVFVRVETADGVVGWGEAGLEGHSAAVEGAFTALGDRFTGADALQIEECWRGRNTA